MDVLLICYPKCSTCQKAKKWLEDHAISYQERDIKLQNPAADEIKTWHEKSNLPLKKFFNTSGLVYRSLDLKEKLPTMSEEEQLALLASDGMLVKRPLLLAGDKVLIGFRMAEWEAALL